MEMQGQMQTPSASAAVRQPEALKINKEKILGTHCRSAITYFGLNSEDHKNFKIKDIGKRIVKTESPGSWFSRGFLKDGKHPPDIKVLKSPLESLGENRDKMPKDSSIRLDYTGHSGAVDIKETVVFDSKSRQMLREGRLGISAHVGELALSMSNSSISNEISLLYVSSVEIREDGCYYRKDLTYDDFEPAFKRAFPNNFNDATKQLTIDDKFLAKAGYHYAHKIQYGSVFVAVVEFTSVSREVANTVSASFAARSHFTSGELEGVFKKHKKGLKVTQSMRVSYAGCRDMPDSVVGDRRAAQAGFKEVQNILSDAQARTKSFSLAADKTAKDARDKESIKGLSLAVIHCEPWLELASFVGAAPFFDEKDTDLLSAFDRYLGDDHYGNALRQLELMSSVDKQREAIETLFSEYNLDSVSFACYACVHARHDGLNWRDVFPEELQSFLEAINVSQGGRIFYETIRQLSFYVFYHRR